MSGTDYIAQAGDTAGHVLDNNVWLGGTDYYEWFLPEPFEAVPIYDFIPDTTIWQYTEYAKHFFFASTPSSGNQTGLVRTYGINPCGEGSPGEDNEICVVNEDDPEGDVDCNPDPQPIFYYPNPASSLLEVDLSLQEYKVFTVTIYDEFQVVHYNDQCTNIVKTVDVAGLSNGTYYLHINDDNNDLILSPILIINH